MPSSAFDELKKAPDAFANPYADLTHDFSLPSERVSGQDFMNAESPSAFNDRSVQGGETQQRRLNRFKAADLQERGIPAYTTDRGDVTAVTDETGKALLGQHGDIAYDSQGEPRQITYGETGGPVLKDPFAALPARTDPDTGNIEKTGRNGLYQYLGQDPVIAAAKLQETKDKAVQKEAALLGRKISLDEHDLTTGKHEHKALTETLQSQVPTLLDPKYQDADQPTVLKAVEDHFNAEYASPEANATGWFGDTLKPEAAALRADIDARKAKALETATNLYGLKDNLNALTETVGAARETERAQVETLLAHQRGELGPLDEEVQNQQKAAAGLYPPVEDQPRMLGGESFEPSKVLPGLGTGEKVKPGAVTPREKIDAPYEAGQPSFRVGDDHSFHLDPNNMMKGLRQAIDAGIVDPEKAKELTPDLRKVQDAINEQRKIIDDSGGSKVAATLHGAGIGAAFLAGFAPGAAAGAKGGAAIAAATGGAGTIVVPVTAIIGGLIGGTLTQVAAKKLVDKLAETNDTIRTFTDAAGMHPYYDMAGNLVSMGAGIPTKGAQALVGLAAKTGNKAAQSIAESYLSSSGGLWRTVSNLAEDASIRKAGGATAANIATALGARVGGAAAVNVAIDTVLNEGAKAMGLQEEGETMPKAVMAALVGSFVSGHGISFKTYKPGEMADILVRAKQAMNGGKDINTVLSKPEAEAFNAFATELKRKINTGEIPMDTEAVAGTVRQALQGGKNYGVSAAEISGKGGKPGLGEGLTAPKPPSGGSPTKPVEPAPGEKPAVATEVPPTGKTSEPTKPAKGGEVASGKEEIVTKGETKGPDTAAILTAEKRFVEEGGHADKLDAQNKLVALREAFPDPAARIKAIEERLAPATESAPTGSKSVVPPSGGSPATTDSDLTPKGDGKPAARAGTTPETGIVRMNTDYGKRVIEKRVGDVYDPESSDDLAFSRGGVGNDEISQAEAKKLTGKDHPVGTQIVTQVTKAGDIYVAEVKGDAVSTSASSNEGGKMNIVPSPGREAHAPQIKGPHIVSSAVSYKGQTLVGSKWNTPHAGIGAEHMEAHPELLTDVPEGARGFIVQDAKGQQAFVPRKKLDVAMAQAAGQIEGPISDKGVQSQQLKQAKEKSNEQKTPVTQGKPETKPAEVGQSGASEPGGLLPKVQGPRGKAGATVESAEDSGRASVEKAKVTHGAKIKALGVPIVEATWPSGFKTEPDASSIGVDLKTIGELKAAIRENNGNHEQWPVDALHEEGEHALDILATRASGQDFGDLHRGFFNELDEKAQAAVREFYPDTTNLVNHGAEYVRMVRQYRELGRTTESNFRSTKKIEPFLKGPQSPGLEAHLKRMESPTAGEKPPSGGSPVASKELIEKGKKAFEGLFAGLPRYASEVQTQGSQVSEGDVEQLRKSNKERLKAGEVSAPATVEPLGAAKPIAQLPIPKEKRAPMFDLIDAMEKEGITTPEKVAGYLDAISGGKARPFSQSLWDMMAAAGAVERGTHNWPSIYSQNMPEDEKPPRGGIKPQNAEQLTRVLTQQLSDRPVTRRELTELASETGLSVKAIDEAAELGIVIRARELARPSIGTVEERFDSLVELYNRQPNLTAKTSTSKVNQAYSTPAPLAFAASVLADITGGKRVYEPTAGNGMLLIEADPVKAVVNELDAARATALKLMGHNPHVEDATRFTPKGIIDRVIANPPFGTIITDDQSKKQWPLAGTDETTREIDHAISLKALSAMQDDGRAVLILGGKNKLLKGDARADAYTRGDGAKFWKTLYDQYQVVDQFTLNGDLYTKQGAGWPVDVVVVAGRGKSPIQLPSADGPRILNSWDDLRTELGRTDADRIAAGRYDPEKDRERVGGIIGAIRGIASTDAPPRPEVSPEQPTTQPGTATAGADLAQPDSGQQSAVIGGPLPSDRSPAPRTGQPGPVGAGAVAGQPEQSGQQLAEGFRVPYKPASKLPSFKIFVPSNMEVPAREALARLEAQVGPIDEYVREKLGYREDADMGQYFSAEQMDALALGIHAIENKTAFVLGDQGGVGKGRVAAGMMAYAIHQGKLPIFITKDVKLYAAMIEDLHDIGKDDITPIFTDNDISFVDYSERKWKQSNMTKVMKEIGRTGKLSGADALFTTYSQIASDLPPKYKASKAERYGMKAKHQAPPDGARMEALKKLAPGSVIIADESHLAAGDSIRAWRLAPLLAQAHGVYYSSATFAKRPDSMGIYSRTSLSHATSSIDDLVDAMKQGGVPLQQVVSATLAADGLYLRRERDFGKAVFRTHINVDTKERDTRLADNYTDGIRSILSISNKMAEARKEINKILRREGKKMHVANAPKIETTNFASKLHNLISQYLFAIKAESMVRRAVEGVTKGFANVKGEVKPHKVIIAFQNTMEQPILALESSRHPLTFNGMLLQYLDSQRVLTSGSGPTAQTTTITDKPDPNFENLSDQQLEGMLIGQVVTGAGEDTATVNEPALAELFRRIMAGIFKETAEKLEKLDLADMPLSPIDHIKRQLTLAGIKNAEITKRGTGIDEDGAIYRLHPSTNTKAAHLSYLSDFNNGDTDVLLINASGSTGISAHSSAKFKRTDPRAMIIGQPHLDINEFMQTTYRIDRTGQVHQPYYELLQTAIPAELRPAAILGKKMSKLNANTTSNAESEISEGNKGTDIFNQYGDEVVFNYLKSDPYFTQMLDMPKIIDDSGNILPIADVKALYEEDGQFAAAVTGRAAVLPTLAQEIFWEKVMSDYVAHINYLNELGENELVSDTVDLKAETLESKELTEAKTGTSGFDAASQMEKIRADIGMKPLQAAEVVQMMKAVDEDAIRAGWNASNEAWKKAELTRLAEKVLSWDDEKVTAYQTRWREQEEEISAALGLIGTGLHIKTDKGMDGYGAITAVQLDPEHPLTPSKQIFTVHVNTTKRSIKVPASQLPTIAREAVGDFEIIYESSAERSNQRYMITGNLLAAYLAIKDAAPTAKIVNYTTDKGDLRQGILMPAKFTPGSLSKKRVVESPKHMLELLMAGRALNNAGSELTVVKAPSGGFVIRVPASRVMGGAYWRDSQLAKLMEGNEFVERGGAMIGKFGLDNSHLVYQRLLDLQATLFYTEQAEEPLGAARPVRAAKAFKDQVDGVAKEVGMTAKESYRMLQHLVSPATGVAMDAHDQVMRMLGERNQKGYQIDKVLEAASAAFDDMPRVEQIAFIDRMKTGEAQPTPELQQVATAMRKIDTESWEAAVNAYKALGFKDAEVPLKWLKNHYRVLWKKIPGSTDDEKSAWIGKARRGLRGSMGQHKQHTLDTMSDGLEMGGIPYSYNPVMMFKLAQADLWKLTSTLRTWKWAKDNGFVEFARGAFPKAPDGMVELDDAIARVYFPADSGEGLINAGKYFVEEGFGRLLNNYLSKDHIRATKIGRGLMWLKNATTSLELSLSPFHAVFETLEAVGSNIGHGLTQLVNRAPKAALKGDFGPLGEALHSMTIGAIASPVTGFNLGRQIQQAAIDPEAYFKTPAGKQMEKTYPGARQAINALWAGGWKPNDLEQDWKNASIRTFVDAVSDIKEGTSDNYIGAGLRAFPAFNEMLMKPLFDHYIPNLKVAQFFKEFLEAKQQNERKLKGGVLTEAALARQVWRFVEDRFGEMNFDSLFWNSNFKTAMQLMFRSVTWKLGSLEAFAGAFGGQAKEFRDAFKERRAPELHRNMAWLFGMFLLTATLGAIISQVLGQKKPKDLVDFVFPQIDPKDDKVRVSLPTYFKDLVHLIHSPTSYVTSSMSGWIGRVMDLLRNKDYYGVQIRDEDDGIVKQALAVGKYTGETLLPFSIRGYKNLSAQDVDGLRKTLALLAINPAPRHVSQTSAEKASEKYWVGRSTDAGIKPEQFEARSEKRKLVQEIRHGKSPDISGALSAGTIKPRDIKEIYKRASMGALASQVLHMPLEDAEKVYAKATAQEKLQLASVMGKKRANSYKRNKTPFSGFLK